MVGLVVGLRSSSTSAGASVAFVIDKYPPFIGGAEHQAELLARLLSARLERCDVFTAQADATSDTPAVAIRRLGTSRPWPGRHAVNFVLAFRSLLVHARRYSIVHGHALSGLTCGAVLGARLRGRPTLIKVCSTGPDGDVAKLTRPAGGRWLWPILRRSSAFVVPSPGMVAELVAGGVGLEAIAVIPNALAPDRERSASRSKSGARADLGLPEAATVLFVGRLSPEKGLDRLMRVWDRVAPVCDARLVIVGDGPEAQHLAAWANRSASAGRIHLAGARRDVDRFYRAADVVVVPSRTETFGNVIAEAMAHGLAVVTTPVGLASHVMRHEDNGLVVSPTDDDAMASAVVRLVRDAALRERLGRAARRAALACFSSDSVVERYVNLYRRLTGRAAVAAA